MVRTVCPAEVTAALPARVVAPDDMVLDLPDIGLAWLAQHFDREALLEARLLDAKGQCPNG